VGDRGDRPPGQPRVKQIPPGPVEAKAFDVQRDGALFGFEQLVQVAGEMLTAAAISAGPRAGS
jgi:hypothetical protein